MNIRDFLKVMIDNDASDIYITAEAPPMYRIQGVTRPAGKTPLDEATTEELANSIMNEKQKAEFAQELEMNLALSYPDLGRFRVNIFRQRGHVGLVIRQIKVDIETLDDLKLPHVLKEVIMTKMGLILVVGATGSGKSTSMAAMIDYRNSNSPGHIITIEDPVEFVHQHKKSVITQREIGVDTHSFQNALKSALRQAPDVILVGEIRDLVTMESAIHFAETGHLCMGTLHANNANQALERVLNFFPADVHASLFMQLSLNLRAIISQRLIKTLDGKRAAAIEILLGSPRVKDLIQKGQIDVLKEAMMGGTQEGMQTFDQAIYALYSEGRISFEEAIANADSPNDIRLRIKMEKIKGGEETEEEGAFQLEEAAKAEKKKK